MREDKPLYRGDICNIYHQPRFNRVCVLFIRKCLQINTKNKKSNGYEQALYKIKTHDKCSILLVIKECKLN